MKKLVHAALLLFSANVFAQNTIPIPDTLTGTNITLTMHNDSMVILPGKKTKTLAYNSFNFLGPTLIFNKWQAVNATIINQIGDTTTLHWHGLHIAAKNDGGPHTQILNGASSNPQFNILNNASMFWYHPHFMGKTAAQAIKGASGLIIVRDSAEAALTLPRKYGVDDVPLIVKSLQLDSNNQFLPKGMQDSTLLVNGVINPQYSLPAQVVRLRLLNGSGERTFNFGFTANKQFYVIGNDGGLLNAPVPVTRIRLSPGERAEVLVNLSGMSTQTIYLMSYAAELPMGVQGGPLMVMGTGGPPMASPLNGKNFNILKLNIVAATASPVTTIPTTLVPVTPIPASQASINRHITFTSPNLMLMDGPFTFNNLAFDMMRIDYKIPLNQTEIWTLMDTTMVAHPFHVHDVQFFVLDRDGNSPPPEERGWKDVVLVQPNETVRIIMQFTDFADSTIPYMYHCHILMHEDDGMMGQFVVMPQTASGIHNLASEANNISLYPNPSPSTITINAKNIIEIQLFDMLDNHIITTTNKDIDISNLQNGIYLVQVKTNTATTTQKIIVQH